ncbi:unnamed protein product [Calicophoron daubneyi]|uniref:Death-associated protein 1 n=1 Tax=Calicophoron daubneyi TaxID=300641 RepID=A0AAV2TNC5_CALDB
MSDKKEAKEVSHPPAVKVAGARIAKHTREPEEKPLPRSEIVKQEAEYNTEITAVSAIDLLTREEREFHDESVKSSFVKPQPKVQKPHTDPSKRIIQQPLK